jgi:aspartyl-tRNA synthetase
MCEQQSYGTYGLMQSGATFASKNIDFKKISDLDDSLEGQTVWIRGRLHTSRVKGKSCFASIRHQIYTVQICGFASETFTKEMIKFIGGVSKVCIYWL